MSVRHRILLLRGDNCRFQSWISRGWPPKSSHRGHWVRRLPQNAIACDELEKARAFNRRLNEGTTATQSRSYDWVREAMTKSGLPGNKWHVGHMCPGGGKPKTWLGNKARNLMAQTAKDNAGRGGLQSKQMTAAEAAFYSRTLNTCADLPPKEELQA